jgi:hypothetical protein
MRLVSSTGWSVVLPDDFIQKDNKDSWQAHNPQGSRVVYIASLDVGSSAARPSADQIAQRAFKDDTGVIDFKSGPVVGRARVSAEEGTWVVNAISAITGRVATITITLTDEADVAWALDSWKSIRFDGHQRKQTHRWFRRGAS